MSPNSKDLQPAPDSQGLPVLTEPIEGAIPVESVEKTFQSGALEAYEASGQNAPVAEDFNKISVSRSNPFNNES